MSDALLQNIRVIGERRTVLFKLVCRLCCGRIRDVIFHAERTGDLSHPAAQLADLVSTQVNGEEDGHLLTEKNIRFLPEFLGEDM